MDMSTHGEACKPRQTKRLSVHRVFINIEPVSKLPAAVDPQNRARHGIIICNDDEKLLTPRSNRRTALVGTQGALSPLESVHERGPDWSRQDRAVGGNPVNWIDQGCGPVNRDVVP
jgi:hypothetical protein